MARPEPSTARFRERRRFLSGTRDWQRALFIPLTILAWLAVILVIGWVLAHLLKTVLTLILAGVVAFALGPLVGILQRWMPRSLAIAVAYLFGFSVVLGVVTLIVLTAASQVTALVHHLPSYGADAKK